MWILIKILPHYDVSEARVKPSSQPLIGVAFLEFLQSLEVSNVGIKGFYRSKERYFQWGSTW